MTEKKEIIIKVSAAWEKRPKDYGDKDASGIDYKTPFRGQWEITECKGHPEINGGHYSPDFDETPGSIRKYFKDTYSERYPNHKIIIVLTIVKDDRNPTMSDFF